MYDVKRGQDMVVLCLGYRFLVSAVADRLKIWFDMWECWFKGREKI
jgi:hypothetical protein